MTARNGYVTTIAKILVYLAVAAVFLFPILFIISNSFMSGEEIMNRLTSGLTDYNMSKLQYNGIHFVEFTLFPSMLSLDEYRHILLINPLYLRLFWNSVLITIPVTLGQVLVALPTAYAFEKSRFRYKELIYYAYIVIMLLPIQLALVSHWRVANWLHFSNSYLAIILPGIFSPFGVFLIRQQMKALPWDFAEAAEIDGAGNLLILRKIIMPVIRPAIAALGILVFIEYWNLIDQSIVFINDPFLEPLSAYLSRIVTNLSPEIFAVSVLYMTFPAIVFLLCQEQFEQGIQLFSMKN